MHPANNTALVAGLLYLLTGIPAAISDGTLRESERTSLGQQDS